VTDMIAKFCMFSRAVDRMDALLSQKPFWRMFETPDSLLVLQELSMEVLCNVVVEMGRERKLPKMDEQKKKKKNAAGKEQEMDATKEEQKHFEGMEGQAITVFDFAEILQRTERRVHDDLLGSGPRGVDELREIHTRNATRYLKAMTRKEQQAHKAVERSRAAASSSSSSASDAKKSSSTDKFAMLASAAEPMKSMAETGKTMTGNVVGAAGGVFNRFKEFGLRPSSGAGKKDGNSGGGDTDGQNEMEEIDFAKAPSAKAKEGSGGDDDSEGGEDNKKVAEKGEQAAPKSAMEEAKDFLDAVDGDLDSKAEETKKEFADMLGDTPAASSADYFTIDDDDFL